MNDEDFRKSIAAVMPMTIRVMYDIAQNESAGKTARRDAIKQLLARGFARPDHDAEDPNFRPTPMSAEVRQRLTEMLASLK